MSTVIVEKYQEVDPVKNRFLGYRFAKNGRTCGDKRCDYCGRWFTWDIANVERYILERRWNEQKGEPIHCHNSACQDYHARWLKHLDKLKTDQTYVESNFIERRKREGMQEQTAFSLFQRLKGKGVVA